MDLSKFVSLLQSGILYFARADTLDDPFEGSVPKTNAEMAQLIIKYRSVVPQFSAFKNMSEQEIIGMYAQMSHHRKQVRKEMFVNCWHMNSHESSAMWKLYSQSSDAVCIQTTYRKLTSLTPSWVTVGMVQYLDYDLHVIAEDNLYNPFLCKRKSFEHEREVRAVAWSPTGATVGGDELRKLINGEGLRLPIDLNNFIDAVYVSPTSPMWFKTIVEELAKTYGLKATVHQSSLAASPLY